MIIFFPHGAMLLLSVSARCVREVFLDILGQLIAGGKTVVDDDIKNPHDYPPG
jgi:hypothetical protein